jgi:hypothetical protein
MSCARADDGKTDDAIIREFVESSHTHDVLGARADVLRLLHENAQSRAIWVVRR